MRRFAGLIIAFVLLFILVFGVSALLFPGWLVQPNWYITLSGTILVTGLALIAEEIVAGVVSFVFEDKDLKERMLFIISNKYREISRRLDNVTQTQINKEKKSRKYIPNVFVETTEIKEELRYFCEPFLFFPKIVEQTTRKVQNDYIIDLLKKTYYPLEHQRKPELSGKIRKQQDLESKIGLFITFLDQQNNILDVLSADGENPGIKPELRSKIPADYAHVHDYLSPKLYFSGVFKNTIEHAKEDLDLLTHKILIVKAVAGHGKTNLLCDFSENFLLKKKHKCLYIGARELNHLGEQETIEQAIMRTIFPDEYQFADILRLIRFDKNIGTFFIVIDGINEHKNLVLLSVALEQFIQRMNDHN